MKDSDQQIIALLNQIKDLSGGGGGAVSWGAILGTLADQTDLNTALGTKQTAAQVQALIDAIHGGTYATTVTAASTTILTVNSKYVQRFTGSTTQTMRLPSGSTLSTGFTFLVINDSSGVVTIKNADSATVIVVPGLSLAIVTCTDTDNELWTARQLSGFASLATSSVIQTTHGLSIGNFVRHNGTAYVKAQADSAANAEVIGIVSAVVDADTFSLTTAGLVTGLSGLTAGATYFLDPVSAGAITATEPTTDGQISKPVFIAVSTTAGYFFNMRGAEVGAGTAAYLVYTALLTQSGSDPPVVIVLDNTLGEEVVWSYNGTGQFVGTLVGAFTANKTAIITSPDPAGKDAPHFLQGDLNSSSANTVVIRSYDSSNTLANSVITNDFLEIRVYP